MPEGREVDQRRGRLGSCPDIGLPVVKPLDGATTGAAFSSTSKTRKKSRQAFAIAPLDEGSGVLVERSIPGTEHRLLVVGGSLLPPAAATWCASSATANPRSDLIETRSTPTPRRGPTELHLLSLIRIDDPAATMELTRQGWTPTRCRPAAARSADPAQRQPRLRRHRPGPSRQRRPAALAVRIIGLDIAGIDLVAEDISSPAAEQGGAIVEVNAGPSLLMHLKPAIGEPRLVGRPSSTTCSPRGQRTHSIVSITGSRARPPSPGSRPPGSPVRQGVGLASSDGLFLDRRHVQKADAANWRAAHRVLLNQAAELAIFENGARAILGEDWPTTAARWASSPTLIRMKASRLRHRQTPTSSQRCAQVDVVLSRQRCRAQRGRPAGWSKWRNSPTAR